MGNPRRRRFTCRFCSHTQTRHSPKGIYVRCEKCGKAQPGEVMARDLELIGAMKPVKIERETRRERQKPAPAAPAPAAPPPSKPRRTRVGAPAAAAPEPRPKRRGRPAPRAAVSEPEPPAKPGSQGLLGRLFAG